MLGSVAKDNAQLETRSVRSSVCVVYVASYCELGFIDLYIHNNDTGAYTYVHLASGNTGLYTGYNRAFPDNSLHT